MVTLVGIVCHTVPHSGNYCKHYIIRRELDIKRDKENIMYLHADGMWNISTYPSGMYTSLPYAYQAIEKAIEKGNWTIQRLFWEEVKE